MPSKKFRQVGMIAVAACLAMTAVACGGDDSGGSSSSGSSAGAESDSLTATRVRVAGIDSWTQSMAIRVGIDQGFFADEGLDVSYVGIAAGPDMVTAVIGGSAEIGLPSAASPFGAIATGDAGLRLISATRIGGDYQLAVSSRFAQEHGITAEMPIDDVFPLTAGARFASASAGGSITTLTRLLLGAYGVDPENDVEISYNDNVPSILANFEQNRADAFIFPSDLTSLAAERKGALTWDIVQATATPDLAINPAEVMVTTESFAREHPDTVVAFLRGLWKSWEHMGQDRAGTQQLMTDLFPEMPLASFDAIYNNMVERGFYLSEASFDAALRVVNASRDTPFEGITYDEHVISTFQDEALEELGLIGQVQMP